MNKILCQSEMTIEPSKTFGSKIGCDKSGITISISRQKETANERINLRKENFIKNATKLHLGKYDYSKFHYSNSKINGIIICKIHGEFLQTPNTHLMGGGCKKCGIKKVTDLHSSNLVEFICKSNKVHGKRYDYSKSIYLGRHRNIEIICKKHGSFWQYAGNHLRGCHCPTCSKILNGLKRRLTAEQFIKRARKIHTDEYDYSIVKYKNTESPVNILCKNHGKFKQVVGDHLSGAGCPLCYGTPKKSTKQFIEDARKIFGNLYDYSKVKYTHNKEIVVIICPKHGEFKKKPNNHLSGYGCPTCSISLGESFIRMFLINNNISFKHQKTFGGCRNPKTGYLLRFDFYLPEKNILIEYDGKQHFIQDGYVGKHKISMREFNDLKYKDQLKDTYALQNNIKLVRIKYTDIKNISQILENNT